MCLPGRTCHSHATGNVAMITYAALSHAISVVFDRCPGMLEIARLAMDFSAAAMWLPYIPHNLTNVELWGFFMPET